METTFIYVLKDPTTNEIRYVGKSNNPKKRLYRHCDRNKDIGTHKRNWINKILDKNLKPILEIIKEVPKFDWQKQEKFYIEYYSSIGCDLVNWGDGGEGLTYGNQTSFKKGQGGKSVIVFNLDGTIYKNFNSLIDCKRFFNGEKSGGIYMVLSKKRKKCYGYTYIRECEYNVMSTDEIKEHFVWVNSIDYKKNSSSFKKGATAWEGAQDNLVSAERKKVYQYSLEDIFIKEWNSSIDISNELKFSAECVRSHCRNYRNTHKYNGYKWYYEKINSSKDDKKES